MNRFDLPWDHPVRDDARRHAAITRESRVLDRVRRDVQSVLPFRWIVRVSASYSPSRYVVVYYVGLSERTMGWQTTRSDPDPDALLPMAKAYVDECMAGTVPCQPCGTPDEGIPTPRESTPPCPVCSGVDGAVMHRNCILR